MALTEVPCELLCMKNLKQLYLFNNKLCSLPSEIAHLKTLERLYVRLLYRLDRDLTEAMFFQVGGNQLTSLPPELGLLTNLKLLNVRHSKQVDLDLTLRRVLSGLRKPAHVAAC
jgi:leucine-rich repeat protein SHOC2